MKSMNSSVCVVIVTYNRLTDLKITLEKYEEQTIKPTSLIVVDNASRDGTYEFLEEWKSNGGKFRRLAIHSEKNLGGAGGFSIGIEEAMKSDCDFIFLSDDDAIPKEDVLEKLFQHYNQMHLQENIAALCTRVNDQFGISYVHRSMVRKGLFSIRRISTQEKDYEAPYFDVDLLTFVGALLKRSTVERIGLPLSEYFIHEDDAEYSTRIRETGRIVCVTDSIMTHPFGGNETKHWIEYYTTRNYVNYIGRHYPRRYQVYAELEKYIKKCSIFAAVVKHRSKNYRRMNKIAIKDGRVGNLGISELYKPGQEIG